MELNDKKLEVFVEKLMANDTLEKPSVDFTNTILEQLNVESKAITYKPLISKWMWFIIALSVLLIVSYSLFFSPDSVNSSRFSELLNLPQFKFNTFENINFNFSKTLMYSVLAMVIMLGFQVPILKAYLNKRVRF